MPCYDDRAEIDAARRIRHGDAKSAIICGLIREQRGAKNFAYQWFEHHSRIDLLRSAVQYDWQDPQIAMAQSRCDEVLDRAYQELCAPALKTAADAGAAQAGGN